MADTDSTAPLLTALTLPGIVDVTGGPVTVTASAGASDVGAGVRDVIVTFDRAFQAGFGLESSFSFYDTIDSFADGVSTDFRTFSEDTAPGTYLVSRVDVTDQAGNSTIYSTDDLKQLGFHTSVMVVDRNATPTASLMAPASVIEGNDPAILLSVVLSNVTAASGTVTVAIVPDRSTATDGSDVQVPAHASGFSITQSAIGSHTLALPAIPIIDDLIAEGAETVTLRVTVSGQIFDTGTDTTVVTVNLIDNDRGGTAGSDVLTGSAARDTLTGGGGADTFRNTAAGLNGDTISDLGVDDRIVISDATLAGFSASLSGSVLFYTGGQLTLGSVPGQHVAVRAAAEGGVEVKVGAAPPAGDAAHDYNGDGRSDILWRNADGTLSNWLARGDGGFTGNDANALTQVGTDWRVTGIADVNGDGRDDIIWRNADGALSNWLGTASGGFAGNDANAFVRVGTDWQVAGTGDFNGDGRDDLLWRSADGTLSDWLGNPNGSLTGNDANALARVGLDWQVIGTGDFNGDGRDDILWRNADGTLADWLGRADGGFTGNDAAFSARVGLDWQVVGTGDFNGDGRDDMLWRNADGALSNWLATASGGFTANDANAFAAVPTDWSVVGTGDYNGDGRDDILWRSDGGALSNWLGTASGGFVGNDANAFAQVGVSWTVQPSDPLFG